jgi:hypothetical protein
MIYVCTWRTKRSEGTIDMDTRTAADARKKARAVLRDGYGLKVHIVSVQRWEPGRERRKSE